MGSTRSEERRSISEKIATTTPCRRQPRKRPVSPGTAQPRRGAPIRVARAGREHGWAGGCRGWESPASADSPARRRRVSSSCTKGDSQPTVARAGSSWLMLPPHLLRWSGRDPTVPQVCLRSSGCVGVRSGRVAPGVAVEHRRPIRHSGRCWRCCAPARSGDTPRITDEVTAGTQAGCPSSLLVQCTRGPGAVGACGTEPGPRHSAWRRQAVKVNGAGSKTIGGASADDAGWMLGHPQYPALRP